MTINVTLVIESATTVIELHQKKKQPASSILSSLAHQSTLISSTSTASRESRSTGYYNLTQQKCQNYITNEMSQTNCFKHNITGTISSTKDLSSAPTLKSKTEITPTTNINVCRHHKPMMMRPTATARIRQRAKLSPNVLMRLCLLMYLLNVIQTLNAINAIYAINSAAPIQQQTIATQQQQQQQATNSRYSFSVSRSLSKSGQAFVDERAPNGSIVAAVSLIDTDQSASNNQQYQQQSDNSRNSAGSPSIINSETSTQTYAAVQQSSATMYGFTNNSSSSGSLPTTMAIEKGNELNHFTLVSARYSHIIRVNGPLDKHKIPVYNLTIIARQNYSSTVLASANLVIKVNNCTPKFTTPNIQTGAPSQSTPVGFFQLPLTDTLQANTKILTVTATDCDEDDILVYKIISCDDELLAESQDLGPECPIKIDDSTGELRTITTIDKERTLKIFILIEVRDGAGNKDTMHVVLSKSLTPAPETPASSFGSTTQDPTVYGVAIVMAFLLSIMLVLSVCFVRIRCMGKAHDHPHHHHHHHHSHPRIHAHHTAHHHAPHHLDHVHHHSTHRISTPASHQSLHHVNSSMQSLRHDWPMHHHISSIHHARSVSSPNPHPHQHPYQQQQQQQQLQQPYYDQQQSSQIT